MAKKGDWVLTHNIILTPQQRAPQVPEDTHGVPLEMWVGSPDGGCRNRRRGGDNNPHG